MLEVRVVETLVRVGRHGREAGGWSVLLCDGGVVVREYPCRDHCHAEAVADVLRQQHRLRIPDVAAKGPKRPRAVLHA